MRLSDAFVQEFDVENRYTRKTLERVPLEKGEWKPHDKSMTLGWLATFIYNDSADEQGGMFRDDRQARSGVVA